MKKIGLIGGLGPEATLLYYKGIHAAFRESYETSGFPEMIIESIDLKRFTDLAGAGRWEDITGLLSPAADRLHNAGAEIGAICSNTPHRVFDAIQARTALPLLSIVDSAVDYTRSRGLDRVGLMGTSFTMAASFYPDAFQKKGIEIFLPEDDEREYIQQKLFQEIELGIIRDETKRRFLDIIERMKTVRGIRGILLACTELPLIIRPEDVDITYLDTTDIHVRAIVKRTVD